MQENTPDLWRDLIPTKEKEAHKYDNGFALVYGAVELTGATRLVASACVRMGIGVVTVLSPKGSGSIYRASLPAHIMVRDDIKWDHKNVSVKIYGSGGLPVQPNYDEKIPIVLDADALKDLPKSLSPNYILTPHDGEFTKAFPNIRGSRAEKAVKAARLINAHIVLKGADTIIASPDGKYIINSHAPALLATAGSGDVLAGMIGGLVGQKIDIFNACCAATWIHGECAYQFGKGLVASDIIDQIPNVLQNI